MNKIQKLTQPKGSNLCGQAIIAMLGNTSIPEVVEVIDKGGLTTTRDIIRALKIYGFKACSDKLMRIPKGWIKPNLCIVKIRFPKTSRSHWILWHGKENHFYDPALKYNVGHDFYGLIGARMTSYLEIRQ